MSVRFENLLVCYFLLISCFHSSPWKFQPWLQPFLTGGVWKIRLHTISTNRCSCIRVWRRVDVAGRMTHMDGPRHSAFSWGNVGEEKVPSSRYQQPRPAWPRSPFVPPGSQDVVLHAVVFHHITPNKTDRTWSGVQRLSSRNKQKRKSDVMLLVEDFIQKKTLWFNFSVFFGSKSVGINCLNVLRIKIM